MRGAGDCCSRESMYYDALKGDHGLPHDPVTALVSPRPIGWISTVCRRGIRNLAPYSFFNLVAGRPPVVMLSSGSKKDTQRNIEETGEFVCNVATWDLRHEVNASSARVAPHIDEFDVTGLHSSASRWVRPPRVLRAPAALECRYVKTIALPRDLDGTPHDFSLIVGLVVGIYVDDRLIHDGFVDVTLIRPLSRLGYTDYAVTDQVFSMERPLEPGT